jgi:hypothetical protein
VIGKAANPRFFKNLTTVKLPALEETIPVIPFYFAICTSTLRKLCKQYLKQHVEGRSVALLCK